MNLKAILAVAVAGSIFSGTASSPASAQSDVVSLDAAIIADALYTAHGGPRKSVDFLDDIRLQATADLGPLGVPGGTLFIFGRAMNFSEFSDHHLGEFQKVSNIDTFPAVRLYEAWYDQTFLDSRLSLRAGLYDFNAEFDVTPPGLLFLNASQGIGTEIGQTGIAGPSIFPVTSMAARIAWRDPSGFVVMAAVLDGVPGDPAHPKRTAIKLGNGDGAFITAETQYIWDGGQINLGAWRYTAPFEDLATLAGGAPMSRKGNQGIYTAVSGTIVGSDTGPRLDGYVRLGTAARAFNPVDVYLGGGLVGTGLSAARPDDQLGIAVGVARTGNAFRQDAMATGVAVSRAETIVEITYRAPLTPWLTVQPDAQLILHPGFNAGQKSGIVVGIRFELLPFAVQ